MISVPAVVTSSCAVIVALVSALLGLFAAGFAGASPADDLGSPLQEVRDAAAAFQREHFVSPSRTFWDTVIIRIKPGTTEGEVGELLRPFGVKRGGGFGRGGFLSWFYQLDDVWRLQCTYRSEDHVLVGTELSVWMRYFQVTPERGFSGRWTTYFANGHRYQEIQYANGKYSGTFSTFHPDGILLSVQHYGSDSLEDEETGYFSSGQPMYRIQYKPHSPAGTWTHYSEDGSVRSTREFSSEVLHPERSWPRAAFTLSPAPSPPPKGFP